MKKKLLFLILITFVKSSFSQEIGLKQWTQEINFLDYSQLFIDSSDNNFPKTYSQLSSLPFQKFDVEKINDIEKTRWFRIELRNHEKFRTKKYFSFGFSNEYITIYKFVDSKLKQIDHTGTMIALSDKSVNIGRQELSTFELDSAQKVVFYIKVVNKSAFARQLFIYSLASFKVFNEDTFKKTFVDIKLINSFFYGAFLVMFLYNLIALIILKSRMYGFYIGLIILFFLYNASNDGLIPELFLVDFIYLDRYFKILIAPLMMVFFVLFTRIYMQTSKYYSLIDKIFLSGIALLLFTYVFFAFGEWYIGINILLIVSSLIILLIFLTSIFRVRYVNSSGVFYLLINSLFLILSFTYILYFANIIPHTSEYKPIEYIIELMAIIQFAMFSLGLYNRVKKAETKLISQMKINEKEKENLIIYKNNELEQKVNERTKDIYDQKLEITVINEQLEFKVRERTKKLKKAYRDLLNLNYELDSFIYRAAHDIRGPITTIMGLCNLAVLEKDFKKCQEYILILDKYSKSTQVTLNRILGVNDLKNNHIKLSYFTLNTLRNNVSALLINNQDLSKVNITYHLPVDDEIYSDIYLLELILQNLIDNAIRFRKTKTDIKPYCNIVFTKEVDFITIIVSDNGEGIAESIKDKIFDMFYRGSEYSSGSGLGLYITKIAIMKLNGSIQLIKTKNDTIFEVTLPYFKDKEKIKEAMRNLQAPIN